ncbi:FtsX-like permease family protein [Actinoplanes sp. NPDC051859]|uniref:FtsX-like permease family protein n=1 Tax=Actinoplanes sp. NPDC051859 TaxID=3363909 RepID=UPI0037A2ABB2
MSALIRRFRAYAGHLGLLAALGLLAGLIFTGLPRAADELTDQGLGEEIAALPFQVRDLSYRPSSDVEYAIPPPSIITSELDGAQGRLPAPLRELVDERWFIAKAGPEGLEWTGPAPFDGGCRPKAQVRYQSGYEEQLRLVSGRMPGAADGMEVVVEAGAAAETKLRAGSRLMLNAEVSVTVVGIVERTNPSARFWDGVPAGAAPCPNPDEGLTSQFTMFTDARRAWESALVPEWRFAFDTERLTAADLPALTAAAVQARRSPSQGMVANTGLDTALAKFAERLRGMQALLAVVQAGLVATMVGLLVLVARLLTDRRRDEFALLRARGASSIRIAMRMLGETILVVPVAVAGGWALARLVPGRSDLADLVLVLLVGAAALFAAPLLAAFTRGDARGRQDLARFRPSARRLTAEGFVVALAVLGVVLARRRGLGTGGVDFYLVSVPVLLAVSAALVAVRLLPWPLQQFSRIAARARGAVPFLGLSRAGRGAPVNVGPLAILVVAVATGVFTAAIAGTVGAARDRATDLAIAADVQLSGGVFDPATGARLAAVPGVEAVAPALLLQGSQVTGKSASPVQVQLLVVPGVDAAKVMRSELPAVLVEARPGGPAPAVVSPRIAAAIGAGGKIDVQGRSYEFRVAEVRDSVPGLAADSELFVVLPWQALPAPDFQPIRPNRYFIAGADVSEPALLAAGNEGQRSYLQRVLQRPVPNERLPEPTTVVTWEAHRAALGTGGVNGVLAFFYTAGSAGAALLALLAVVLTVLADAPGRGRTLSRLRTMGMSLRQGRSLLIYELVPLVAVAILAGGLVGIALPALLGAVLELDSFTAGVDTRIVVDPWLPVAALGLVAAALAVAMLVESLANRRMRLGEVLRLGEEN